MRETAASAFLLVCPDQMRFSNFVKAERLFVFSVSRAERFISLNSGVSTNATNTDQLTQTEKTIKKAYANRVSGNIFNRAC